MLKAVASDRQITSPRLHTGELLTITGADSPTACYSTHYVLEQFK